jgi:hypothetical protein
MNSYTDNRQDKDDGVNTKASACNEKRLILLFGISAVAFVAFVAFNCDICHLGHIT